MSNISLQSLKSDIIAMGSETQTMAKMYFYYGAMNSGKSIDLLKAAHNYREQGKDVILMTSALDKREKRGQIKSRIGLSAKAYPIFDGNNLYKMVKQINPFAHCILIDEAQFLKEHHVLELAKVTDILNIPVIAFGLKNDFQNNLFEGSRAFLEYADKIQEIKTICWFCGKKATMNLRIHNGEPVYEGNQYLTGGNNLYYPVCRYHYFHPPKNLHAKRR